MTKKWRERGEYRQGELNWAAEFDDGYMVNRKAAQVVVVKAAKIDIDLLKKYMGDCEGCHYLIGSIDGDGQLINRCSSRKLDNNCYVPDGAIITRDDKRFDKTEFIRLPSGAWELVEPDSE